MVAGQGSGVVGYHQDVMTWNGLWSANGCAGSHIWLLKHAGYVQRISRQKQDETGTCGGAKDESWIRHD